MSTPIVEGRHAGEFILSEAPGKRSREVVTISDSIAIKAGQVLGKVTADGKFNFYDNANAIVGTGSAAAVAMYPLSATDTNRKITVIMRDAEVNGNCLEWDAEAGADKTAGIADLLALGIIVR
jgi:head decoration protein D